MPSVNVVSVGKIKSPSVREAVSEYEKRVSRYASFKSTELADRPIPDGASAAQEREVLAKEARDILSKIGSRDYVVSLCVEGKELSSVELAKKLEDIFMTHSSVVFVIGSSLGLDDSIKQRSDFRLSMSKMTFPHNLARLMLTEQIYRAFKINSNETYHK